MKHRLGLVSVSFRAESPERILKEMKKVGLSFIEWGSDVHVPPEKAPEIAALQAQYGITCCSYGSYFRLGVSPMEELPPLLAAAKVLGTDVVRVWCGNKNAADYTEIEKAALFAACREAASLAEKEGITLCSECHNKTYTNCKEGALEALRAVASPRFRMYWQPNQFTTIEENLAYARLVAPYTEHLHVFHWRGREKLPLSEAVGLWRDYLSLFEGERTLLLEFMPDGKIETLGREALALWEIAQ